MYRCSGKITLDDFVQYRVFLSREYLLRRVLCLFLIYPLTFGVSYLVAVIFQEEMPFFEYVPTLTAVVVLFLVWMYITSRRAYVFRDARKYYESNKELQEEQRYSVDENGITQKSKNGHATYVWEKLHRVKTDRDSIYVFTALHVAMVVKERYFGTADEYREAKGYILKQYREKKQAGKRAK